MSIAENLSKVRERIASAASKAGVDASGITLIAVSKMQESSAIVEAIQAGITDIGENYIQEAVDKFDTIGPIVRWHMIGHLQTNKVRFAVPIFDLIQSVDSVQLAKEIGKRSVAHGKVTDILLEANISGEESKFGVAPEGALALGDEIANIEGVCVRGFMGMAPFVDDETAIRKSFALLKGLWDRLPDENRKWLSMGMSSDFEMAIEEGSNMVRVGTAIFGPRPPRA